MQQRLFLFAKIGVSAFAVSHHLGAATPPCVTVGAEEVCVQSIDLRHKLTPEERVMVEEAAALAIMTVASDEFMHGLEELREQVLAVPFETDRWRSARMEFARKSNAEIVSELLSFLGRLEIDSYGGIRAWFSYNNPLMGTRAKEGNKDGPIILNRAYLDDEKTTSAMVANSIIHEALHRIGFEHEFKSPCEIPYLVGNMAERLISGQGAQCDFSSAEALRLRPNAA